MFRKVGVLKHLLDVGRKNILVCLYFQIKKKSVRMIIEVLRTMKIIRFECVLYKM